MTEKRFSFDDEITWENISPNSRIEIFPQKAVELLNKLHEENEQLKQQLREEQLRTTPITLTTKISDEDYKKIANLIRSALSNNQTSN